MGQTHLFVYLCISSGNMPYFLISFVMVAVINDYLKCINLLGIIK
jgi:hypothetical protein